MVMDLSCVVHKMDRPFSMFGFDLLGPSNHFRNLWFGSTKCKPKYLADHIPEMRKEFSCVKAKNDKFGFFRTSEFRVSRVLRTSGRDSIRRKVQNQNL
jgi:hypothetical protein